MSSALPKRPNQLLMPTLMDRLIDNAPNETSESAQDYAMSPAQMRQVVQRDLAHLLNTINLDDQIDAQLYEQASRSVLNYGVSPFAGTFISQRNWLQVEMVLRQAITLFEPRLVPDSLEVVALKDVKGEHQNSLPFEIRGLIQMQPYPMAFLVQSSFDLETRRLAVVE